MKGKTAKAETVEPKDQPKDASVKEGEGTGSAEAAKPLPDGRHMCADFMKSEMDQTGAERKSALNDFIITAVQEHFREKKVVYAEEQVFDVVTGVVVDKKAGKPTAFLVTGAEKMDKDPKSHRIPCLGEVVTAPGKKVFHLVTFGSTSLYMGADGGLPSIVPVLADDSDQAAPTAAVVFEVERVEIAVPEKVQADSPALSMEGIKVQTVDGKRSVILDVNVPFMEFRFSQDAVRSLKTGEPVKLSRKQTPCEKEGEKKANSLKRKGADEDNKGAKALKHLQR